MFCRVVVFWKEDMLRRVLEHVYTHVCVPSLGRIGLKVISLQPWLGRCRLGDTIFSSEIITHVVV